MFVPGTNKYISGVASLAIGHSYSIDSGMGGSFPLTYEGKVNGKHRFKNHSEEFSRLYPHFDVAEADLPSTIYVVAPQEPYFRKEQDEFKASRGIHPEHEADCKACVRANTLYIEFTGPDEWLDVLFLPHDHKTPIGLRIRANTAPPNTSRRLSLPNLAQEIDREIGVGLKWALSQDQRFWTANNVAKAYEWLVAKGFKAHGEEATWIETGRWPDSEFRVLTTQGFMRVAANTYDEAVAIAKRDGHTVK